jgi:hypothetical protein
VEATLPVVDIEERVAEIEERLRTHLRSIRNCDRWRNGNQMSTVRAYFKGLLEGLTMQQLAVVMGFADAKALRLWRQRLEIDHSFHNVGPSWTHYEAPWARGPGWA